MSVLPGCWLPFVVPLPEGEVDGKGWYRVGWVSSGGVHIAGRVHLAHRARVLQAHWQLQAEAVSRAEVSVSRPRLVLPQRKAV